ncbi:hypothetical protein RP20_CCG004734 [Aedes albopictus]|nr:hypothetical protein RP20_CCG004734 [Aedes albopictus]
MFLAIFIILTRLFNISLAPIPPYIAAYSIHVIEFLMTHQPGTFYCLFYDLSREFPTNSVFDDLLRTPRLDNVVKYVLDSWFVTNFYVPMPQKPSLVVVYVGESSIPNTVRLMFLIMNPNTKVLVLVNSRWFEPIREMINILSDRTDGGRVFNKVVIPIWKAGLPMC